MSRFLHDKDAIPEPVPSHHWCELAAELAERANALEVALFRVLNCYFLSDLTHADPVVTQAAQIADDVLRSDPTFDSRELPHDAFRPIDKDDLGKDN